MQSLEEYMKAHGYTMGEDAEMWDALGYAMMALYDMGIITDEEWPVLVKRFGKKAASLVTEVNDE